MHIDKLIKQFCDCDDEFTYHGSYSGRGMFGKKCVGLSGGNPCKMLMELIDFFYVMSMDEASIFAEQVENEVCMDHMGKGYIVYFPKVQEGGDLDD